VIQTQAEYNDTTASVVDQRYDARGLVIAQSVPYTATSNPDVPWYVAPAAPAETRTAYDALGRVTQVTAPDGSVTRQAYDIVYAATDPDFNPARAVVYQIDANAYFTRQSFDAYGQLRSVSESEGTWGSQNPWVNETRTRYTYDTLGNLTTVTDHAGNVSRMQYDVLSRKTVMTDTDMGVWRYQYDPAGNLTTQTDARGQVVWFGYDALNRLTQKRVGSSTGAILASYTYDCGSPTCPAGNYGKGYRTGMTDSSGSTTWQYDARGRVTQERKTISGNQFYTTYTYDALDRVVTMTYPDGEVVQSTYNAAGQPASLRSTTYNNYPYVNSATYNARGQQLTLGYGNSLTTAYDYYDGAGEPFSMRLQHLTVSSDRLDLTYQYDAVGNVTRLQDQSAAISETLTFTYDALDRLLTVRGAYNATYVYNTIGNLTSSTDLGTLYYLDPAHAHAATHVGGKLATHRKYTYDANGSMLTRVENGATYTQGWNQENRLQTVTVNGTTTTFTYDGDGVLVKKVVGSATTYYIGPHFEKTSAPEVVTKYYTFGGQRVAMRVCNGSNGSCGTNGVNSTLTYLHSDHLGSASLATNSTGGVVNTMRYTAYGLARSGTMVTDRRFTGQRYEAGLGLYDYNARFYDPLLGRFISADTIVPSPGNPQSLNRYSYVNNNPLRYIDPDGHILLEAAIILLLGGAVLLANPQPVAAPELGWVAPTNVDMHTGTKEYLDTVPGTGDISDVYALCTGKRLFTGESQSRGESGVAVVLGAAPFVTGGMLKQARRLYQHGDELLNLAPVARHVLDNALRGFSRLDFRAGGEAFSITRQRMAHFLSRHHPEFWGALGESTRSLNNAFDAGLTVDDIADLAQKTVQQGYGNRVLLSNGAYEYVTEIDGKWFRARTYNGELVNFVPLPQTP